MINLWWRMQRWKKRRKRKKKRKMSKREGWWMITGFVKDEEWRIEGEVMQQGEGVRGR